MSTKGQLKGAGDKPVSPEQMELPHHAGLRRTGGQCRRLLLKHWRRKNADGPSKLGAHKRISDEALMVCIWAIHAEVRQEYGWLKMWQELVARGHRMGKERVRRLMQQHGIRARCKRKYVVTTDSQHHLPIAPDFPDQGTRCCHMPDTSGADAHQRSANLRQTGYQDAFPLSLADARAIAPLSASSQGRYSHMGALSSCLRMTSAHPCGGHDIRTAASHRAFNLAR